MNIVFVSVQGGVVTINNNTKDTLVLLTDWDNEEDVHPELSAYIAQGEIPDSEGLLQEDEQ